jgi:hypothetical protein
MEESFSGMGRAISIPDFILPAREKRRRCRAGLALAAPGAVLMRADTNGRTAMEDGK